MERWLNSVTFHLSSHMFCNLNCSLLLNKFILKNRKNGWVLSPTDLFYAAQSNSNRLVPAALGFLRGIYCFLKCHSNQSSSIRFWMRVLGSSPFGKKCRRRCPRTQTLPMYSWAMNRTLTPSALSPLPQWQRSYSLYDQMKQKVEGEIFMKD